MKKITPEEFGKLETKVQDCIWNMEYINHIDNDGSIQCIRRFKYCPFQKERKQGSYYRIYCTIDEPISSLKISENKNYVTETK
jgi:hypothetical protein